jgi:hypothetical protein
MSYSIKTYITNLYIDIRKKLKFNIYSSPDNDNNSNNNTFHDNSNIMSNENEHISKKAKIVNIDKCNEKVKIVNMDKYIDLNLDIKIIKFITEFLAYTDEDLPNVFDTKLSIYPQLEDLPKIFRRLRQYRIINSDYVFLHCIGLILKLRNLNPAIHITKKSGIIMFITALCISSKFCEDGSFTAKTYEAIINIHMNFIMEKEIIFLKLIDWNLLINDDIIESIYAMIVLNTN